MVPPRRLVSNLIVALLAAYYLVGVVLFVRDLRTCSEDSEMVRRFGEELDTQSTAQVAWSLIKLALFIMLLHIPLWIVRV